MDNIRADPGGREARFHRLFTDSHADVLRFIERRVHPSHADDAESADAARTDRLWARVHDLTAEAPDAAAPSPLPFAGAAGPGGVSPWSASLRPRPAPLRSPCPA